MRPSLWLLLARASICVALAGSAALYVHYLDPADSGFCGLQSGCEAARRSGFSYFLGSRFISLPLFALLAFGALLGLSFRCEGTRATAESSAPKSESAAARLWDSPALTLFAASGAGASAAVVLIAYQAFVIGAFCWLCLVVDFAAIASAGAAFALARAERSKQAIRSALSKPAWVGLAALAAASPIVWSAIKSPPPVPAAVQALYVPGKINVVEFADLECPHCRRLHEVLKPLLAEYGDRVHFVRLHRPLPMHPHAEHAARAALCAEAQGQGEPMVDLLFSIELSAESINRAAEALRLDPLRFDTCVDAPTTTAKLEEHAARLPDEALEGLPTTYVGSKRLLGVPSEAMLRDALERAQKPPKFAPTSPLFIAVVILLAAALVSFGRRRALPEAAEPG